MKKTILALSLLALGSAGAYAQVRGGISTDGFSVRIGTSDGDRSCKKLVRQLQTEKFELERDLRSCQIRPHHGGGSELRRVKSELATTKYELQNAKNKIYDLKLEVERLESQINPRRGGHRGGYFDLAASISACGEINNSYYAQQCTKLASKHKIHAGVIKGCSDISNAVFALKCVEYAGVNNGTEYQAKACSKISNSHYAAECMKAAASKNVRGDAVAACVGSNSNTVFQYQCVDQL